MELTSKTDLSRAEPSEDKPRPADVTEASLAEDGPTENGLTENGLTESGLTENGLTESGLTENAPSGAGPTEDGLSPAEDGLSPAESSAAGDTDQEINHRKQRYWRLRRIEWAILTFFFLVVVAFGVNFKRAEVIGHSMEPTLHNGEMVLVWRTASSFEPYRVGDIIVFRAADGEELIKRIAFIQTPTGTRRMPEELWTPRGYLTVPQLLFGTQRLEFPGYEKSLAEARAGHIIHKTIYVLGDNTWRADDSRHFGPIDPHTILGKVIAP